MNVSFSWIWLFIAPTLSGALGAMFQMPQPSLGYHRAAWSILMACVTVAFTLPMRYEGSYTQLHTIIHSLTIVFIILLLAIFFCILDHSQSSITQIHERRRSAHPSTLPPLDPHITNSITFTYRAAFVCVLVSYVALITNVVLL